MSKHTPTLAEIRARVDAFPADVPEMYQTLVKDRDQLLRLHDAAIAALEGAHEWLSGWASADPYIGRIETAIKAAKGAQ